MQQYVLGGEYSPLAYLAELCWLSCGCSKIARNHTSNSIHTSNCFELLACRGRGARQGTR
jgi:hypothetical protein